MSLGVAVHVVISVSFFGQSFTTPTDGFTLSRVAVAVAQLLHNH
jgi:hypothetical protein